MVKKRAVKKVTKKTVTKKVTPSKQPQSLWDHLKQMFMVITPFLISAGILSNYLITNAPTTAVMGLSTTANGSAYYLPCVNPGSETSHRTFIFWEVPTRYPCPSTTPTITPPMHLSGTPTWTTPTLAPNQTIDLYGTYYDANLNLYTNPSVKLLLKNMNSGKIYTISSSPTWKLQNIMPGSYRITITPFNKNYITVNNTVCFDCNTAAHWITLTTNTFSVTVLNDPKNPTKHNFENIYLQFIPETAPHAGHN